MKGLILTNAYYSAPPYDHSARRIKEELENLGVSADIRRNSFFPARMGGNSEIISAVCGYDFCVYLDKDKYASEMLEKAGMRLFNSHSAVSACDDKMRTLIRLAGSGVPIPRTMPGILCYTPSAAVSGNAVQTVAGELGYPVIVKASHGSMGKGVYLAKNEEELLGRMEELKCSPHLFQEYVSESYGRDLRVIVVGGKVSGGMERRSNGDFRSNIGAGGKGLPYAVDEDTAALCAKVAETLRLDFCGIDLLFGKNGFLVCEVNSNAFFREFETVVGVNVAAAYAKHIVSEMKN